MSRGRLAERQLFGKGIGGVEEGTRWIVDTEGFQGQMRGLN